MILQQISEIVWQWYNEGRQSAANQKLSQRDIEQYCIMAIGDVLRKRYYENKSAGNEDITDFISTSLESKEYPLSSPTMNGMRKAVVTDNVIRLPRSQDVVNILPIADGNCQESISESITLVQPGEENFYQGADFSGFQYAVLKGKNINTYNLPNCVKAILVERMYLDENTDFSTDVAFEAATFVLGTALKIKDIKPISDNNNDANRNELRYQLEKANEKM